MSFFELVKKNWISQMEIEQKRKWPSRIAMGNLDKIHYESYLVETYHHAGLNPQIQAFATMFFKGNPRETIKRFYQHAISEIAHDILALDDLEALGVNKEKVIKSRPLPETLALNAFATHYIQFNNVLGYLGYLFHLEFMPTQGGEAIIGSLKKAGIPDKALSFLIEHSEVDVSHNKFMVSYCDSLVKTDEDCEEVIYAVKCACTLHHRMIESAMERAENKEIFWR